jgi:hypothetical protein
MLCIALLAPASARLLQPSGSSNGYKKARQQWIDGGYSCDPPAGSDQLPGLDVVKEGFWPDVVLAVIFPECEEEYELWPKMITNCKKGAEKCAIEKATECVNDLDCEAFGKLVASDVAGDFCSIENKGIPSFDTKDSIGKAKTQYYKSAQQEVEDLAAAGLCKDLPIDVVWLPEDVTEISTKCDKEVEKMARTAKFQNRTHPLCNSSILNELPSPD